MAIYPLHTSTIITKDVLINSPFKAGMALILDTNGRAIKADSQQLVFNNTYQKYGRFLGFAASDHDLSGNTIIVPDNVGNNHLDVNNRFVKNENTEYAAPKRGLLDLQDTAVSNFYNPSDIVTTSKRGIGVFNTPGDYFVTDQFNPVLHGDYGFDGLDVQTINPGDLLTFGGGINAGKLVKVNVNSFGPDVIVVGQVSRYNPTTGLLYFKQVNYSVGFGGSSSTILALDAGLTVSHPGSGSNWFDLSGNARNFTLTNGPVYSSSNSGLISFDGSDDYALTNYTITSNPITVLVWYNSRNFSSASVVDGLISNYESTAQGFDIRKQDTGLHITQSLGGSGFVNIFITNSVLDNTWYNIAFTYDGNTLITYTNGSSVASGILAGTRLNGTKIVIGTSAFATSARTLSCFVSEVRILNRALTDSELLNYYNLTKSRYGL